MILPKDYKEFIELLNGNSVNYVLVGAHASAYHGVSRTTGDIDFFVEKTPENIARLVKVMQDFGFSPGTFTAEVFQNDCVQVGYAPVRIDLLTSLSGVEFDEVQASSVKDEVDGIEIPVIGREMLIKNRRAVGRTRDLADIEALEQVGKRQ